MDIDLTYPQFADDQLCRRVFFYNGRHPFEAGTSLTLQVSQQSSPLVFEGIACSQLEHGSSQEASALADTIYEFLCKHIPKDCPSMEEFIPNDRGIYREDPNTDVTADTGRPIRRDYH